MKSFFLLIMLLLPLAVYAQPGPLVITEHDWTICAGGNLFGIEQHAVAQVRVGRGSWPGPTSTASPASGRNRFVSAAAERKVGLKERLTNDTNGHEFSYRRKQRERRGNCI